MSSDYMNLLRVAGPKEEVDAFVALAKAGNVNLSLEKLLPPPAELPEGPDLERWKVANWGSPSPWPHMQPAERIVEFDLHIADYSFATKGTPPFELLESISWRHPEIVLSLAVFEENMVHAEVRVVHGETRFERKLDPDKLIERRDAGELDEDHVFDELKEVAREATDRILGGPASPRLP